MKNYIAILSFVLLGANHVSAQKPYLKVEANNTLGFTSTNPTRFSNASWNPDARFKYSHIFFNTKLLTLNMGLSFGVVLTSGNKLELGISGGESKNGFRINTMDKASWSYDIYIPAEAYSNVGFRYIQLRALYYKTLKKTDNKLSLIAGLQMGISEKREALISLMDFQVDDDVFINGQATDYSNKAANLYLVFGVEHRLYIYETYLFNAAIFVNLAVTNNTFSTQQVNLEITEANETKKYTFDSYSTGSGVLFQLSRTFDLSKLFAKKKVEN